MGNKCETNPVKVKNETGMSTFSTPIQYSFGISSQSNKTRARNKRGSNREEVKLSLFSDDILLYLRDPKNTTKTLLEIINSLNKVAGYKINIKKSVAW
jgi:hypothetical protein